MKPLDSFPVITNSIVALRPNLTREQAERLLRPASFSGLVRQLTLGPLRAIAEFYVPFRLYQIEIINCGCRQIRFFAIDAVNGSLDLYGFDAAPAAGELVAIKTRNRPAPLLNDDHARQILTDKVRRLLFATGFFRLRGLHISAAPATMDFHIPYWVGLYGSDGDLRLLAIDAVRRRLEGAKLSHLLHNWLRSSQPSQGN